MRHRGLLVAACTLATMAGVHPAAAAPVSPEHCAGVWVVVDPGQSAPSLRCATSHASGADALASAGYAVVRQGSMICQLDGRPDTCAIAATSYWSYWHASRLPDGGFGAWQYSTAGASAYVPVQGDADGWVFGDGRTPPALLPPAGSSDPAPTAVPDSSSPFPAPVPVAPDRGSPSGVLITLGLVIGGLGGALLVRRLR